MSVKELDALFPKLKGWRLIGGSAADTPVAERFDFVIRRDLAASLYDGMSGKEVGERYRTLDEWNRWMLLGADIVKPGLPGAADRRDRVLQGLPQMVHRRLLLLHRAPEGEAAYALAVGHPR